MVLLKNVESFLFFDETISGTVTSNVFTNASGRFEKGVIEVKGSTTARKVKVQLSLDSEGTRTWTDTQPVDIVTGNRVSEITTHGIYTFDCLGCAVRIIASDTVGGPLVVFGKFLG